MYYLLNISFPYTSYATKHGKSMTSNLRIASAPKSSYMMTSDERLDDALKRISEKI